LNLALAGSTGKLQFQADGTMGATFSNLAPYRTDSASVMVEALSLQDACGRFGVPKFLKMDIEGAEKAVVREALKFMESHAIEWGIESHHMVDGRLSYVDLEELFPQAGCCVKSELVDGFFHTWAWPQTST